MKKNWTEKLPVTEKIMLGSRERDFVHGEGWRHQNWPQLGGAVITGKNEATSKMRVLACGWPAAHFGRLVFFSNN